MIRFLVRLLLNGLALLLISYFYDGMHVSGLTAAIIAALILGVVNAVIRPIVMFLTLPINILTLGLFGLVVNGLLLWAVSSFIPGFHVNGFMAALVGGILLSVAGWLVDRLVNALA